MLRSGTRPLVQKLETKLDGDEFRRDCFKEHGRTCFFHGTKTVLDAVTRAPRRRRPDERCLKDATDPMHVVPRSQLGPKTRFALGAINGRPGCRVCHDLEDAGRLSFPDAVYNRAVRALNKFSPKIGLRER
jgi:hypothetical protein